MLRIPDLVRDTRLDTRVKGNVTCHIIHDSDPSGRERVLTRKEYWSRTKRIGRGGFANVWLEKCVKGEKDMTWRALKEIPKPAASRHKSDYNRELEALAKFSQQRYVRCFVRSLGWYEDDSNIYIAMEYFPLGDLYHFLKEVPPLPEKDVQSIMRQLLEGLVMLHENGFAHRDLKPGNILIQSQDPWWVKIGDFGISKRLEEGREVLSTVKGTLSFMAPEMLNFVDKSECFTDAHSASCASDLWALGEIATQMLTKNPIFANLGLLHAYSRDVTLFPEASLRQAGANDECVDLIRRLTHPSPKSRLSAEEALGHEWFVSQRSSNPRPQSVSSDRFSDFEETTSFDRTQNFAENDLLAEPSGVWSTKFADEEPTSIAFSPTSSQTTLQYQPAINTTKFYHRSKPSVSDAHTDTLRFAANSTSSSHTQESELQQSTSPHLPVSDSTSQIESSSSQPSVRPAQNASKAIPATQKGEVMFRVPASQDGDLALEKGDIITVTWRTESIEDFWVGFSADGRVGRFPGYAVWLSPQIQASPQVDKVKSSNSAVPDAPATPRESVNTMMSMSKRDLAETKATIESRIASENKPLPRQSGKSQLGETNDHSNRPRKRFGLEPHDVAATLSSDKSRGSEQVRPKTDSTAQSICTLSTSVKHDADYIKNHLRGAQVHEREFTKFRFTVSLARPETHPPGSLPLHPDRYTENTDTLVVIDVQAWPKTNDFTRFLHNIFKQVIQLVNSDRYKRGHGSIRRMPVVIAIISSAKLDRTQINLLRSLGIGPSYDGVHTHHALDESGQSHQITCRGQDVDPVGNRKITAQIFETIANPDLARSNSLLVAIGGGGSPVRVMFVDDRINDHEGWSKLILSSLGARFLLKFPLDGSSSTTKIASTAVAEKWKIAVKPDHSEQLRARKVENFIKAGADRFEALKARQIEDTNDSTDRESTRGGRSEGTLPREYVNRAEDKLKRSEG